MNSFISSFKAIFIAIGIIVLIEFSCWFFGKPDPFNNINLFQLAYLRPENTTNIALLYKFRTALELHSDFLQVGDSSGIHGLNPLIIQKKLPMITYTNSNLGADFGYLGHYYIAKTILAHENHAKYLVLYVTPMAWPAYVHDVNRTLEKNVYSAFLTPWHHLTPPSLMFRQQVTDLVYYGKTHEDPDSQTAKLGSTFNRQFKETRGFIPRETLMNRTEILPQGACIFSEWFQPSKEGKKPIEFFYSSLEKMALLAREKKIKFILIFNPVSCEEREDIGTLRIERELARFRQNYPEVIMPFPFITTWPKERFMDSWHFYSWAATIMSERVADSLKKIIDNPSWRGISMPTVAEIDKRITYAENHPFRPASCEDLPLKSFAANSERYKNCVGLSFVTIKPASFIMGACNKKKDCPKGIEPDIFASRNEFPAHLVKLKNKFQLSQSPVTVEQFNTFLKYYGSDKMDVATANLKLNPDYLEANKGDPQRPVTMISYNAASAYVDWLNKIKPVTDKGWYRLPTEAEWEYAARSGKQTPYWWGNEMKLNMANCAGCTDKNNKLPIVAGHFPANLFGLYDMNGNIWEWTQDCYRDWYSKKHKDGKAFEIANCQSRVLRGGSADNDPRMIRATARLEFDVVAHSKTTGFRVVRVEA